MTKTAALPDLHSSASRISARGYAGFAADQPLGPYQFDRRTPGPDDVQLDILYCGVCHSDLHTVRNEWGGAVYPLVPGHEIIGRVSAAGARVTRFAVGDIAAVGCMVDSCRECPECRAGEEIYCSGGGTYTYNSKDLVSGGMTYGGYSSRIVVTQDFVFAVDPALDPAGAAPLLCAGITTWSPLRHWEVGRGTRVGVVGLGGLGHMGVKLAKALGAEVTLFTTSPGKIEDAHRLGADDVILTRDPDDRKQHTNRFDFILNTVAFAHDLEAYLQLLRLDGTMCLVGAPEHPHPGISGFTLIAKRRSLAGSLVGGIRQTQEMLDFCASHRIVADVEVIRMDQINAAYERMLRSDVKYRFVIDLETMQEG
jgi:uncharacterized zinc-type alcohol dehydrogenase-like protein